MSLHRPPQVSGKDFQGRGMTVSIFLIAAHTHETYQAERPCQSSCRHTAACVNARGSASDHATARCVR
eukprot:3497431-Prymnesium_polylepis.1